MATLAVLRPTLSGGVWAPAAATATVGDVFDNDGYTMLFVNNQSGGAINVTIDAPGAAAPDQANAFDADVVKSVPSAAQRIFGPFTDKARFNDVNGQVKVICSVVTSVTLQAVRVY